MNALSTNRLSIDPAMSVVDRSAIRRSERGAIRDNPALGIWPILALTGFSIWLLFAYTPLVHAIEGRDAPAAVLPGLNADPHIAVFNDTFYIYPTTDGNPGWTSTSFQVWSSPDLVNWENKGVILDLPRDLKWADLHAWAPAIATKNGKYYYYYSAAQCIGVAVADRPEGPFTDPLGKPLVAKHAFPHMQSIDPMVFVDDDGSAYLYWGQGRCKVVKLNEDMISYNPDDIKDITPPGYNEGPFLHQRSGKFYLSWSEFDTRDPRYSVAYGTSDSPLGPFVKAEVNPILSQQGTVKGAGHHSIVQIPNSDQWVIAFHRFRIPDGNGYHRETCLAPLRHAADGSLTRVDVYETVTAAETEIDLSGTWNVRLDRSRDFDPAGVDASIDFAEVVLPGTLRDSGLGDPVGPMTRWIGGRNDALWEQPQFAPYCGNDNFKMPFWWQPEHHFVGTAYYQRDVTIPEHWVNERIVLTLERPHWLTTIYIDGKPVGKNDSLSVPHQFDLTKSLTPGKHTLTIAIDNSLDQIDVGQNAHSVSDHTQTAWHGIVGDLRLTAEPQIAITHTQVYPSPDGRSIRLKMNFVNSTEAESNEKVTATIQGMENSLATKSFEVELPLGETSFETTIELSKTLSRWDEFNPTLYKLQATIDSSDALFETTFGFRTIKGEKGQLVLNGKPIFLRGTLECCIFPLTGYPATDVESWKRIIRVCQAHGLNHIRFHSWCPPEAAFVAADELGFYYQVECSTWPNQGATLGDGQPVDEWLYREADRVLLEYGNHPSFLLLASGNEPAGPQAGAKYLTPWVKHYKESDDRRLFTSGSGWPMIDANQFHVLPSPRTHQWGQGLNSRINAAAPETMTDYRSIVSRHETPIISHEIGQWCVYPNFDEIKKYTGSLKLKNFEVFRDFLEEAGMSDQAEAFLMASGKLQVMCYKEEIESALRTPSFGGFQLLDMRDFPGQGTALVGMLDPFWDSKPYMNPQEFRRFCGPIVPLARMPKRIWKAEETFVADIEVSHFGPADLQGVTPEWTLSIGNRNIAKGNLPKQAIESAGLRVVGRIEVPLASISKATKCNLEVSIETATGRIANDWDIWVYPSQRESSASDSVMIVKQLDDQAKSHLRSGGKVALFVNPKQIKTKIKLGMSSIFWNTAWTNGQPPHTLGVLCDPKHPALQEFPTEYHSNWQWWELISRAATMELDSFSEPIQPIVQVVPDWFAPQRLALAFEANVLGGKLLMCSIDLENDLGNRAAAQQFRQSLLDYLQSDSFAPSTKVEVHEIESLFREPTVLEKLGAIVQSSPTEKGYEANLVIDNDPNTFWHTRWTPSTVEPPHWLLLDLKKTVNIASLHVLPRQDMSNGRVKTYEVMVSRDGETWATAASGEWPNDNKRKTIRLENATAVRFIKFVAIDEVNGNKFSSLAEISLELK